MKVYSRYKLIEAVLCGVASIALCIVDVMSGDGLILGWIVLMAVIVGRGFYAALSKQGYEKDQKEQVEQKRILRKLFGRWALVMPWASVVFYALALTCSMLAQEWKWVLILLFFVTGALYEIWLSIVVCKHKGLEDIPDL